MTTYHVVAHGTTIFVTTPTKFVQPKPRPQGAGPVLARYPQEGSNDERERGDGVKDGMRVPRKEIRIIDPIKDRLNSSVGSMTMKLPGQRWLGMNW
jgi:hypothetical protein